MDTYTITDAARILKRHVKTLQKWDRDGTLVANRTSTNRRYYTEDQLKKFRSDERANDAEKVMRTIAAKLSDRQMKAVAEYAAGLR